LNCWQRAAAAVAGGEGRRVAVEMAELALGVAGIRNKKYQRQH